MDIFTVAKKMDHNIFRDMDTTRRVEFIGEFAREILCFHDEEGIRRIYGEGAVEMVNDAITTTFNRVMFGEAQAVLALPRPDDGRDKNERG